MANRKLDPATSQIARQPPGPNDRPRPVPTAKKDKREEEQAGPIQTSVYFHLDEINGLDQLIIKIRNQTGRTPRRSQLIRQAVQEFLARTLAAE